MFFPFNNLSTELALEIIRIAASPDFVETPNSSRPYYTTALSLTSVSYAVRRATMPRLLHTVVLSSAPHLLAFIRSILLQRQHQKNHSRLALDYKKLVRRFWSTECWEPVVDEAPDDPLNYSLLYEIIRGVESLGLNFRSLHLLYNGLASANAKPSEDWSCQRVTFAGSFWRWRPLMSTSEGLTFLGRISHLVIWIPNHDSYPLFDDQSPVPNWIEHVPFAMMPNLTYVAFPLLSNRIRHEARGSFHTPTEMVVYTAPCTSKPDPTIFKRWALGPDPLVHGIVIPFRVLPIFSSDKPVDLNWEVAYVQGEGDGAWERAEKVKKLRGNDLE